MRLFVGLDIPADIHSRIVAYMDEMKRVAPNAKWVRPESLHITLKFIGEWRKSEDEIKAALAQAKAKPFDVTFSGAGFFTPRSPRVFWIGIEASDALPQLAASIDSALKPLGVKEEDHEYHPHLTLARTGSGRPSGSPKDRTKPVMYQLKQAIERTPELAQRHFGTMTATDFFLYESKLSRGGAQYTKIARFALT
jgi:2'-5' RNA ligase